MGMQSAALHTGHTVLGCTKPVGPRRLRRSPQQRCNVGSETNPAERAGGGDVDGDVPRERVVKPPGGRSQAQTAMKRHRKGKGAGRVGRPAVERTRASLP